MSSPRPNLFIIGAMKSGTTSLHAYLGTHPDVFMSEPKEPGYFVEEMTWSRGEPWYLSLFAGAGSAAVVGESTAAYSMVPRFPGVPGRIARFNSEVRFVYLMRNPLARTVSHYWHMVQHHCERRDLFTAVREHPPYVNVSNYSMQLTPYFETFGRERVQTLTFEELVADPVAVVQKLFAWLGVDAAFVPPNIGARENVTGPAVEPRKGWVNRFRHSRLWGAVGGFVPRPLRRLGRRLAQRRVERSPQELARVAAYLAPIQAEQVHALRELLGRDFPEWESAGHPPSRLRLSTSSC
jgi:hypothetical protein